MTFLRYYLEVSLSHLYIQELVHYLISLTILSSPIDYPTINIEYKYDYFNKLNMWLTAPKGATLLIIHLQLCWQMSVWPDNVINITLLKSINVDFLN